MATVPSKVKALPNLTIKKSVDTAMMRVMTGATPQVGTTAETALTATSKETLAGDVITASSTVESAWRVGATNVDVPINLIVDNEWNSRFFYPNQEIDDMAQALLREGQKENAKGYLVTDATGKAIKIALISGHKRLRGARVAGLATLRLDIVERPKDALSSYLECRIYNQNRSDETALDNAVRWAGLLKDEKVASQQELAKALGVTESEMSMVLGINRIPNKVLMHMKDRPRTCAMSIAYLISGIFAGETAANPDQEWIAIEIVDAIQSQELSRNEVKRLIESKTTPARQRMRAEVREVAFAGKKGSLKVFKAKGQLAFDIKGLDEPQLADLERRITSIVSDQQALFSTGK